MMEQVRTVTREFVTGDKAVLHLEARSGTVLVEGREGDRVVVDAVVRVWTDLSAEADDAAALVARNMEQDAHRVIVRTPALHDREGWAVFFGPKAPVVDYRVRVPLRTAVRVLSRSGSINISHIEGVVYAEARSGRAGVDDVRGDVTAISRSGGVQIERITGDVNVEARSGKVRLRQVSGAAAISARSGSIEAEGIAGDMRVEARSGAINIEDARGKLIARSAAGSVRYRGRVCADFDIEARAGAIQLCVDPAAPFFLDAETHAGNVRSDLPPRRDGAGGERSGPRVRLRTHAGSIRITKM